MRTIWKAVSRTFVGLLAALVGMGLVSIPVGIGYYFGGFAGAFITPIFFFFCAPILYLIGCKIIDKEDFPPPSFMD